MQVDLSTIAKQFLIHGEFRAAEAYGSGHINDTYCVTFDQGGVPVRYILQRINNVVFKNPVTLMENVQRVTAHLQTKLTMEKTRRALSLIPARDGQAIHRDAAGHYWRVYVFIERARTYDAVESPQQAFEAGRAFGQFQRLLADLPAPRLHETIPNFHHTPKRFEALLKMIEADPNNRASKAKPEIRFAIGCAPWTSVLLEAHDRGEISERITHNDTKFNNVMLDDESGEGICIIDLDTVMPGLVLYDFGDQVRTTTSPVEEDERDLSKVRMQMPMFEALARGYWESAGSFLTKSEKQHLGFSGKLITFENGIRFLTDFLAGDTYFKVHRDSHNLDRCRVQFALVESIVRQEEIMSRFIEGL
jgi:Ser/Thr protein kinase RdoA (MazF antagonist)